MKHKFIKYTYRDGSKSKGTSLFGINDTNVNEANKIAAQLIKQGWAVSIEKREYCDMVLIHGTKPAPYRAPIKRITPCGDGCGISYGR